MASDFLPPWSQVRRVMCCAPTGKGLVFTLLDPNTFQRISAILRCTEDSMAGAVLEATGETADYDNTLFLSTGWVGCDPRWIRADERTALKAWSEGFQQPVCALTGDDDGLTLYVNGDKISSPLGFSLIDRMILEANRHPEKWGREENDALRDMPEEELLRRSAALRKKYFALERSGMTEEVLRDDGSPLEVDVEMMSAFLEEPSPRALGELLEKSVLNGLPGDIFSLSWPEAAGRFLKESAEALQSAPSAALALTGDCAFSEGFKALAAEYCPGRKIISDMDTRNPLLSGLEILAGKLVRDAYRRENLRRFLEWLQSDDAAAAIARQIRDAQTDAVQNALDTFQNVWKEQLRVQWVINDHSPETIITDVGLSFKSKETILQDLTGILKAKLRALFLNRYHEISLGTGYGRCPNDLDRFFGPLDAAVDLHLQNTARHINAFIYRRMALYHAAFTGSNRPTWSFFRFNRNNSERYVSVTGQEWLTEQKAEDMLAWSSCKNRLASRQTARKILSDLLPKTKDLPIGEESEA